MKNQKLLAASGLLLSLVFLAGCGQGAAQKENKVPTATVNNSTKASQEAQQAALPANVTKEPGANVDAEVKNIDKDLQAIDDNSLNQGLSDKDLGL